MVGKDEHITASSLIDSVLFKDMFVIAPNFPNGPGFTQEAGVGVLFLRGPHSAVPPDLSALWCFV